MGVGPGTTIVKDSTTIQHRSSTTENGNFCMREIKLNDLKNIVWERKKDRILRIERPYPKNIYMVSEMRIGHIHEIPTWVGDVAFVYVADRKYLFR